MTYSVIVEDDDHHKPNASPEDLEEISEKFLRSLETKSNQTKNKRKLWSPKCNQNYDDESALKEAEPNSSSIDVENKEIKLRIPIPTYLIPLQFRKQKLNGKSEVYSPATGIILNTPKSIYRKIKQNLIAREPSQICGFLESLDGKANQFC